MTASVLQPLVQVSTALLNRVGYASGRTATLPMLIVFPTSRCNSRCVSCDWWRATGEDDLTIGELEGLADALPGFGTRLVAFSGGEPLLRPDIGAVARLFRARGIVLHLLTSGLALERHAADVASLFERVTLSLDGATREHYAAIRGVDALGAVETGVARLRALAPAVRVTARCTLHALNYRELPALIRKARSLGVDSISFLAADVTSDAFGRHGRPVSSALRLDARQTAEFRSVVEWVLRHEEQAFASGFVTTSPRKLRALPAYYAALQGTTPFPPVACNAPWVSAVVEANGDVRPCFFHPAIGNLRRRSFDSIIREDLPRFRRDLHVASNPTCQRCVCSLKVGMRNVPWR